jgi:tetratricopeptide (TPR) repeat protein
MGNNGQKQIKPSSLPENSEKIISPSASIISTPLIEHLPDGITLVWLDEYASKTCSEDSKNTLTYLRQLNIASIRLFNDINSCLTFIKSISYDQTTQSSKIFLIVSDTFSSEIIPKLKSFSFIDSVFIFCINSSKYQQLINDYKPFIIGIYNDNLTLFNSIDRRIETLNQSILVCHFFAQEQNTTRNLSKDTASFIWFQLFQMIISELKCTENEKTLMLNYCSKQLENDSKQKQMLKLVERFRQTYKSEDAIYWYTKESFVYRLLNTALRTEDIEALYVFRFFIADLCRQLKHEHKKLSAKYNRSPILTVYRGGRISSEELENIKNTVDNLISLNGFISTSIKEWVAIQFIQKQHKRHENTENVLFIIEVDVRSENIICANVEEMSEQKDEAEILFNIGSVFRITEVKYCDNEQKLWKVYMKATEDGITAANDYMKLIRQELTDTNVSIIFGQLFLQLGKYLPAQKYFLELLEQLNQDHPNYPSILYHLALTKGYQGDLKEAEDYLKKVFQCQILHSSNHLDLARTKNALGWIYHYNGELDKAISYYQEALIFAEERIGLNHLINAQSYSLLGDYYLEKYVLDKAENYYKQALEIENIHLPSNHPRIGVTLTDLGNVYRKRNDMNKALEYYKQAESIFQKNLPSNHPYTAYCWSCMGFAYLYQGQIEEARKYHEQALKIYRRVLPADDINIKISEQNSKCTDFRKINDSYVKICAKI